MNYDKKMLRIGMWTLGGALLISVMLQVGFRTQSRQINRARREIVQIQQKIAVAEANFAANVRPEVLRNLVLGLEPKAVAIGFNRTVDVNELENKEGV
ncbi:MAG: hypothetical protein IKJ62_01825 [Alphaproteobacteria bacterium]|nr:hypothetical protein [Alphaproteobacteria bacterium]